MQAIWDVLGMLGSTLSGEISDIDNGISISDVERGNTAVKADSMSCF